jgi:hypothetical protein
MSTTTASPYASFIYGLGTADVEGGAGNQMLANSVNPLFMLTERNVEDNVIYATSYIPTYGTSASRAVDSCVKTGASDLIGQTEGTLYAELNWKASTGAEDMAIWMRFGATSYNEMIALFIGNNFKAQASVRSSAIQQVYSRHD